MLEKWISLNGDTDPLEKDASGQIKNPYTREYMKHMDECQDEIDAMVGLKRNKRSLQKNKVPTALLDRRSFHLGIDVAAGSEGKHVSEDPGVEDILSECSAVRNTPDYPIEIIRLPEDL